MSMPLPDLIAHLEAGRNAIDEDFLEALRLGGHERPAQLALIGGRLDTLLRRARAKQNRS